MQRKTDEEKRLRGTQRPCRTRVEPLPRLAETPPAPDTLTERGRAQWTIIAPEATLVGVTSADLPGLALLAETLGDIATLRDVIDREGATIATEGGSRRAHPALNAMAQARSAARGLLSDFGMSPRGRLALAAPPTKERRNEFEEFAK